MIIRPLILLLIFVTGASADSVTLVDVNFDGAVVGERPPLLDFSPPSTLPSDRLVGMRFGDLVVVDQVAGMNKAAQLLPVGYSQPVVFENALSPTSATTFLFGMDFYLSNFETRGPLFSSSVDEFTVFFDVPEAIRMNFQTTGSTGRISVGSGASVLGNFEFGTTHRLSISLEVSAKTWSATLDDSPLLIDAAFNAGENPVLSSVRINLADDGLLANAPVAYIDNIRLEAVPEPKPVQLALVGGALLMLFRNCRRTAAHRAALRPGFSAKTN